MYPNKFLTSHFWTIQQRSEFQEKTLAERFKYNRQIFRSLQAKVTSIQDEQLKKRVENVFAQIGSGFHPSVEEILDIKDVFSQSPYDILNLSGKHIVSCSLSRNLSRLK